MLSVRRLSLRYPNGKLALADLDLSVRPGEFVTVLGSNGSGKTTLLRCLVRTLKPTAGEVWVSDTELTRLEGEKLRQARLELAMISQHAALVKRRSVLANVATGALGRHESWRSDLGGFPDHELQAAQRYLGEVGLSELSRQRAGTLSGGQAQRVSIARALAQRPRVLLADEPVASLDPEAAEEIMRLLRRLAVESKLAVLCVLHQVELAYAYADRIVGIRDGRKMFDEAPAGLARDSVRYLYVDKAA